MSEQEAVHRTRGDVIQAMEEAGARIASGTSKIEAMEAVNNERVRELTERTAKATALHREQIEADMDIMKVCMEDLRIRFGEQGKTFALRSGIVSLRDSKTTEVSDEALLLKLARRWRIVRLIFVRPQLKLNKTKLAKFLEQHPVLAEKLGAVAWIEQHTRMTFKPVEVQTSLERVLHPLRKELDTKS